MIWLFTWVVFLHASSQECTDEATQEYGTLMTNVVNASRRVDDYKRRHNTTSERQSDLMLFCLKAEPRHEFKGLFDQAAGAVNAMETFGNRQKGPCREAALRASGDLEREVRAIMSRLQRCNQSFR